MVCFTCDNSYFSLNHFFNFQQSLFSKYLKSVGHGKYKTIKKVKPTVLKMKWRTKSNGVDCGIFTMLHMDSYMGDAVSRWDCGLDVESDLQNSQLMRLRIKFCTKILLHEINIHRDKMIEYADEFEKSYSNEERKMLIKNAIKNWGQRVCKY